MPTHSMRCLVGAIHELFLPVDSLSWLRQSTTNYQGCEG